MRDIVPHLFIIGMENMGAVLVDIDAFDVLSIDIPGNIRALVHNEDTLAVCLCLVGKNCAVQPRADY